MVGPDSEHSFDVVVVPDANLHMCFRVKACIFIQWLSLSESSSNCIKGLLAKLVPQCMKMIYDSTIEKSEQKIIA
ncbi:hypothetical protein ACVMB1_000106 [Bradyrhizobium sp. USDA 4504]